MLIFSEQFYKMTENKTVYYTPDPAIILKLYTEIENGKY